MAVLHDILANLFAAPVPDCRDMDAGQWWRQLPDAVAGDSSAMGSAYWKACGQADRAAFGFMAGYQFALRALLHHNGHAQLVKDAGNAILSFCWTEEGGGHPRAVLASLQQENGHWVLQGTKSFCSAVDPAGWLLVAARTGLDAEGRPCLRIAAVPGQTPGVTFGPPHAIPVVPEVVHSAIEFTAVAVEDSGILAGDGYVAYAKCFRDLEDLYVMTGLLAVFLHQTHALQAPQRLTEGVCLLGDAAVLSDEAPGTSEFQLRLAALLQRQTLWWGAQDWQALDPTLAAAWQRDLALRKVAGKARAVRAERAEAWLRSRIS